MSDLTILMQRFTEFNQEQCEATERWFNVVDPDASDRRLLIEAINSGELTTNECDACGEVFINTDDLLNWNNFQGVSYEGNQVNEWVEGHWAGTEATRENRCGCCGE